MHWKSTANTLFYIILQAPGTSCCTSPNAAVLRTRHRASVQPLHRLFSVHISNCNLLLSHLLQEPNKPYFFLKSPPKLYWPEWWKPTIPQLEGALGENPPSHSLKVHLGAIGVSWLCCSPCWYLLRISIPTGKKLMSISLERGLQAWQFPSG